MLHQMTVKPFREQAEGFFYGGKDAYLQKIKIN